MLMVIIFFCVLQVIVGIVQLTKNMIIPEDSRCSDAIFKWVHIINIASSIGIIISVVAIYVDIFV